MPRPANGGLDLRMSESQEITRICNDLLSVAVALAEDQERPAHRPRVNDARNAVIYYLKVIEGKSTAEIRDAIWDFEPHYRNITPLEPKRLSGDKRKASATIREALTEMGVSLSAE